MNKHCFYYLFLLLAAFVSSGAQAQNCILGDCQNGFGKYTYKEGHIYLGEFKGGELSGYGIFVFDNKETYLGQFRNGRYNGYGVYLYQNGEIERGIWNDINLVTPTADDAIGCVYGNCTDGFGAYTYNDGALYIGNFKYGKLDGKGLYMFANGEIYIGLFSGNKYQGRGTFLYSNGKIDDGYWSNNQFTKDMSGSTASGCVYGDCTDGYGTYVFDDGSRYTGNFKKGLLHGEGTYTTAKAERYTGAFANGKYNGYGTYYYNDGRVQQGNWLDNIFQGDVKAKTTGCISGDCVNGTGTYVYSEGHKYVGRFKNGELNGQGSFFFANGDKYVGEFVQSKFNGIGTYTYATGKVESGKWSNNQYLGTTATVGQTNTQPSANVGTTTHSSSTTKERRLALVIGNSNYTNAGTLKNPVNDARAMESALKVAGFDVMKYENLGREEMKRAIDQFGERLSNYDIGLFFFAGHGLQVRGNNYLVPSTAAIASEKDVEYECVEAGRVLAKMEAARNKVNIVVLDACRNNPFERSWSRSVSGNGLAAISAPVGSFIAYATAPGTTASDGSGSNGLYTEQLLKFIQMPGLKIEDVFKQVRINVIKISGGEQTPWEASSLIGDFYFKK
jgi:hypothetical protein